MTNFLSLLSAAALVSLGSGAAAGGFAQPVAEDAIVPVVVAPVAAPAGDWAGGYAGLAIGQGDGEVSVEDASEALPDFNSVGVYGGYLYDLGRYVVGGEVDYSNLDFGDGFETETLVRLKARAGYDAGRFLPYVTAGFASITVDEDTRENGMFAGVGVDAKVGKNVRVGAEYLMHQFNDILEDEFGPGAKLDANTLALRVSYSF